MRNWRIAFIVKFSVWEVGKGKCLYLFLWLFMIVIPASQNTTQAQDVFSDPALHINLEDGLPDLYIKDIKEDKDGFIWIASNGGVSRFDGSRIEVLEDPKLVESFYSTILPDSIRNCVWIGTLMGLFKYDLIADTIQNLTIKNQPGILSDYIFSITSDKLGRIWIGTQKGISSLELGESAFSPVEINFDGDSLFHSHAVDTKDVLVDPKDSSILWVASAAGLLKYNLPLKSVRLMPMKFEGFEGRLNISEIYYNPFDSLMYINCNTQTGSLLPFNFLVFNPQTEEFIKGIQISSSWNSRGIFQHSEDALWLSCDSGVAIYDCVQRKVVEVIENDRPELRPRRVDFKDKNNRIWAYSVDAGIFAYKNETKAVENFYYPVNSSKGYHIVNQIIADKSKENIYLSVFGGEGFYQFNLDRRNWTIIPPPDDYVRNDQLFDGTSAGFFSDGQVIVSSKHGFYNIVRGKLRKISLPGKADTWQNWGRFHVDQSGGIWSFAGGTLARVIINKNHVQEFEDQISINRDIISMPSVREDSKGNIWAIDHTTGYSVIKMPEQTIIHSDTTLHKAFFSEYIKEIFEFRDTLYLLTINYKLGKVLLNDIESGLADYCDLRDWTTSSSGSGEIQPEDLQGVTAMAIDEDGIMWVLGTPGLLRVDLDNQALDLFTENDGLTFKDREMQVFVAEHLINLGRHKIAYSTRKGFHVVRTDALTKNAELPQPYIQNVLVNNIPWSGDSSAYYKKHFRLSPEENYITFDFSAISYSKSREVRFAYKMEGVDLDWVDIGQRHSVSYTNLDGGHRYTFQLKAANADGVWNPEVAQKTLYIGQFWWNTHIVRLSGVVGFLVILYFMNEYRMKRALEKEQLQRKYEKELAEIKMNAFTAQMNPHFIFNSLNSIDYYILKNEPEKASDYLNRFSRLIRMILTHSRSTYISLSDDIEALKLYIEIESLRFEKKFDYIVKASKNLDLESIQVPPMLFQPYVENAIWHGLLHKVDRGRIEVKLEVNEEGDLLTGIIQDNGIGRAKAQELKSKSVRKNNGKSMGMKITQDKIDAINFLHDMKATVEVDDLNGSSGDDTGTRVTIKIPI